jgi:predicted NBD/HSP70 family sugar kinase
MSDRKKVDRLPLAEHGAAELPSVSVDAYNAELRTAEGFLGDRASKRAFQTLLDDWREQAAAGDDEDPLGEEPTEEISKRELEEALVEGEPEAAAVVHGAIEDFAQELAAVIRRFLQLKSWKKTERIVVGGGFREGRIGEIAISRTLVLLKAEDIGIELRPIRHHPDEAGLLGAAHLAPAWIFLGHESILAVDIGGTNIRAGIVKLRLDKADDLSKAEVVEKEHWRYRDEEPSREEALERLIDMLEGLVKKAEKEKLKLAPFIGIGCPGLITGDGSIKRGGQNLPGNWSSSRFHLPDLIAKAIPKIGDHKTVILMHNDAVVQGLSERPFMDDVKRWGVLTIGTGLGNARFTNKEEPDEE